MDNIMKVIDHYLGCMKAGACKVFKDDRGLIDIVYIAVYLGIAVVAGAITLFIANSVAQVTTNVVPSNLKNASDTANMTVSQYHMYNSSNNLYGSADTGFAFLPIVAVAAIGSVAIGYVFGLIPGMKGKEGGGL